jgi:serine/threonine protein kinase
LPATFPAPAGHSPHIHFADFTIALLRCCSFSGGSLSDYLARHSVGEEVARCFFQQLLDAVAFCHSRKIVYRDIKPANVLVTGTQPPFLKLCDFGLVGAG